MANEFRPGGLLEVHHSNDGEPGSWTKIQGDIAADSELGTEPIENELSESASQSGETLTADVHFLDFDGYDSVKEFSRGASKARKFFAFVFDGGDIVKTTRAVYPIVRQAMNPNRQDGDRAWHLRVVIHATTPYEDIESLD